MAKRNDPKEHVLHNFQELKFVDNISCPIRGSLRLYRFHPFTKYMASKLVCSVPTSQMNPEQQESLLRQYKDRIKIKQPHVMYSIECESQKIMKSTQHGTLELFQIFVYFEYGQLNLEEMVFKRAQKKYLMPEIEVWCLIKGVIQAMHFFQTHQIQHGMLQLKSIYFDEEYLLYRVYDQELIAGRWGNWLKYQQTKDPDLFVLLAPETRPFFNQNAQLLDQAQINPFKADVYSFGIILTQFLTLQQQIQDPIRWLSQFYSSNLLDFLQKCLMVDASKRMDWFELNNQALEPTQENKLQEINQKIQAQIQKSFKKK